MSSPALALVSVIVANVWRGCAFSMILLYAGLQRMPRELHEAADLEGAGGLAAAALAAHPAARAGDRVEPRARSRSASFNTFDLIIPLTGGGPARRTEVISLFMYRPRFFDSRPARPRRSPS